MTYSEHELEFTFAKKRCRLTAVAETVCPPRYIGGEVRQTIAAAAASR